MSKLNIRLEKDWLGYQQIYIDDCYIDEYKEGEENDIITLFDDETEALLIKLGIMEEIIDYVKCMAVDDSIDFAVFDRLTERNLIEINDYIGRPMTATTFSNEQKSGGREIITSEIIYYWMVSYNIPFECQYWHLNRLLTLVKVCNIKNNPPKKMSQKEVMARNKALNEARKKQFDTRG